MKGPVLVVEDDRDIQENLHEILKQEGFGARSAFNGREALEYLKAGNPVSVILLDLMMPVMDGHEFMDEMFSGRSGIPEGIPIIVLSATPDLEKVARERGVASVKKPIDLDVLLSAIRHKLET